MPWGSTCISRQHWIPKVDAVTYFDGKALKEKIDTSLPVVKVMLDDSIKMYLPDIKLDNFAKHEKLKKRKGATRLLPG